MAVQKYTQQYFRALYERQARNHTKTFLPALTRAAGILRNTRVLDIGCGDGRITTALAAQGAAVLGIDSAASWITTCKKTHRHPRLAFRHLNATRVGTLPKASFDVVVMNMVLLNVDTKKEITQIMRGISHVLQPGGRLVFSDLHPRCVRAKNLPDRYFTFAPGYDETQDGSQFTAHIRLDAHHTISFTDRHWTKKFYLRALRTAGLKFNKTINIRRSARVRFSKRYTVPEFIFYVARKTATTTR